MAGDKAYPEAMETFEFKRQVIKNRFSIQFLLNLMYKVSRSRIQQAMKRRAFG